MKGRTQQQITWLLLWALTAQSLVSQPAWGKDLIQRTVHMRKPATDRNHCVELLAKEVDWLEHRIDCYGSVVAKQPDVWGQARLTKHRQEYEQQMYQQLSSFNVYLQGTVSRSDQAFLANAFALQAAASAAPAAPKAATSVFGLNRLAPGRSTNVSLASSTPIVSAGGPSGPPGGLGYVPAAAGLIGSPDDFFNAPASPGVNLSHFQLSGNTGLAGGGIGIEPTIALDQRDRYLSHLQELRRKNEGDDTADSPGYGLNLVRIPISVLPGKWTYRGYGAEITLTAEPYLSSSLLPITFRNLIINDVVDQLALPITRAADAYSAAPKSTTNKQDLQRQIDALVRRRNDLTNNRSIDPSQIIAAVRKVLDLFNGPTLSKLLKDNPNLTSALTDLKTTLDALKSPASDGDLNNLKTKLIGVTSSRPLASSINTIDETLMDVTSQLAQVNTLTATLKTQEATLTSIQQKKLAEEAIAANLKGVSDERAHNGTVMAQDAANAASDSNRERDKKIDKEINEVWDASGKFDEQKSLENASGLNTQLADLLKFDVLQPARPKINVAKSAVAAAQDALKASSTVTNSLSTINGELADSIAALTETKSLIGAATSKLESQKGDLLRSVSVVLSAADSLAGGPSDPNISAQIMDVRSSLQQLASSKSPQHFTVLAAKLTPLKELTLGESKEWELAVASIDAALNAIQQQTSDVTNQLDALTAQMSATVSTLLTPSKIAAQLKVASGPASRLRQARNPIPPTQVDTVFGANELCFVALRFVEAYTGPNVVWNQDPNNKHVMYLDVMRFLQAEVQAAHDLLSRTEAVNLWNDPGFPLAELAEAIHGGRFKQVCRMRANFYKAINHMLPSDWNDVVKSGEIDDCDEQVVKSLAWAVLVEAALLNKQLIQDIRESAQTKGCGCANAEGMQFYLPDPDPAAREAFNSYVACRWPIHVFALDPATQQQNIADSFSRRRELQMALSLGFIYGQINAQNLMKFARRLETEIETVDLNETVVGFSHGDDTFGWRFYPRLQSPPTKGTLQTFGETLFGGPRPDGDLLQRRIEPGMRECVALVIMPSFVPYVTIKTRTDWFRLNAHSGWLPERHKREISMVDTMKLSRSIHSMHEMSECLCDSKAYRPGDVGLLLNRVHQLDRQLPMQSMLVQVPIENTLGGYQLFNNGVTDLVPELHGWYGAPGITIYKSKPEPTSTCCTSASSGKAGGAAATAGGASATAAAAAGTAAGGGQQGQASATGATCDCSQPAGGNSSGVSAGGATAQTGQAQQIVSCGCNSPCNLKAVTDATKLATDSTTLAGNALTLATTAASAVAASGQAKATAAAAGGVALPADCNCAGTTVFLVGNHFSVHDTKVIAGGTCLPRDSVTLLSRQVMQVTIPWNCKTVTIEKDKWVDVHVATPYGVTGHLHIPAYSEADASASATSKAMADLTTAVSPLEVVLDNTQPLVVKYQTDGVDFLGFLASNQNSPIKVHCQDDLACLPTTQKGTYDQAFAAVYCGSTKLLTTDPVPLGAATPAPGSAPGRANGLQISADNLWNAILPKLDAPTYAKLSQMHSADPTKVQLAVQLYLNSSDKSKLVPTLHVVGQLCLKFEELKVTFIAPAAKTAAKPAAGAGQPTPAPKPAPAPAEPPAGGGAKTGLKGPSRGGAGLAMPSLAGSSVELIPTPAEKSLEEESLESTFEGPIDIGSGE